MCNLGQFTYFCFFPVKWGVMWAVRHNIKSSYWFSGYSMIGYTYQDRQEEPEQLLLGNHYFSVQSKDHLLLELPEKTSAHVFFK